MSDSAGTPWTGRTLPTGDFAGDDGAANPGLAQALGVAGAAFADESVVVAAIAAARLFVPVVAVAGDPAETSHDTVDAGADMALITLTGPDGRRRVAVCGNPLPQWPDPGEPEAPAGDRPCG